jgi:hypothetical protein
MRSIPHDLDAMATGTVRTQVAAAIDRLQGMSRGLDAQITAMIKAGKSVPGWDRKQGEGRQAWTAPLEEVYALGDLYGLELRKPGAITPKQAIDLGIDGSVISEYSKTPKGEFKVVPTDETKAAKAFK